MKRLWPRSLLGQVLAIAALALLLAQAISVALLLRAGEERRETQMASAATFQLVAGDALDRRAIRRRFRRANRDGADSGIARLSRQGMTVLPPPLRYRTDTLPPMKYPDTAELSALEQRLAAMLGEQGVFPYILAAEIRRAEDDPAVRDFLRTDSRFARRLAGGSDWQDRRILIVAIQREAGGAWEIARAMEPRRDSRAVTVLLGQTALSFALLLGFLFFALRRIARPLALLTDRVECFGQNGGAWQAAPNPLAPAGPQDVRRLIIAHNAMEARIAAMLDEKDVMLGAIGHDLKTPLAALRVRIEGVADDTARGKMAASIEDITRSLDDILSLARVGRPSDTPEQVELSALVAALVEEYEDMGEPVTLDAAQRMAAPVRVTWLRRALRNLVTNALRYGGTARVGLARVGEDAVFTISDDGPGIPDDQLDAMMEPFQRGEASRNRTTGGAGLGLTLARAIAQQHGGTLTLVNRREAGGEPSGLNAVLRIPL